MISLMEKIANLQIIERHPTYDKVGNPQRLTVSEFTPVGLT
ncbi:hypothetical protein P0D71_04185 [Paraburkholderia sp. RL17-383-BIF-A]